MNEVFALVQISFTQSPCEVAESIPEVTVVAVLPNLICWPEFWFSCQSPVEFPAISIVFPNAIVEGNVNVVSVDAVVTYPLSAVIDWVVLELFQVRPPPPPVLNPVIVFPFTEPVPDKVITPVDELYVPPVTAFTVDVLGDPPPVVTLNTFADDRVVALM